MAGTLEGRVSIPAHPTWALSVVVVKVAGLSATADTTGFYRITGVPAGAHTIVASRVMLNDIRHVATIVDGATTVVNFVWTDTSGYGTTVQQPVPTAPALPPPPIEPPLELTPPFGRIDRVSLPDQICHDVSIPVVAVVRNTGQQRGTFLVRLENTATGEVLTDTFPLNGGESKTSRFATIVPRQGTDLRVSTFHDGGADDAVSTRAAPNVFGFAAVRRFSPPAEMRPGKAFDVEVEAVNTGRCRDEFLITVADTDTGAVLLRETSFLSPGESVVWSYHATMVGRRWSLSAETRRRDTAGWLYNDSTSFTVVPIEAIMLDTAQGFCEFRGPMAAYAGSVVGSGIEFVGPEKGEERTALFPGARFAAFSGRAERGDVDRVEFASISDIRARTELGIAAVVNRVVTSIDTKEFKYSTLLPSPLLAALGLRRRRRRRA